MKAIYYVDRDGIYTTVRKVYLNETAYNSRLAEIPADYFKTFGQAKSEAKTYIKYFIEEYKGSLLELSNLKESDL